MIRFVRALVGLAVAISPLTAWAQAWQINRNHSLVWNGQPYLPIGVRIPGDPDRIRQAAQAGIKDVVVELPANGKGWKEAFDTLELSGMRYLVAITSMPPMAPGIAVEPQSYRVNEVTQAIDLDLSFPETVSVYTVLASKADASVAWAKKVDALSGRLTMKVVPPTDLGHILLLYPEYTGRNLPDYWDAFDEYRDGLLIALKKGAPGKGLRGILNPMGSLATLESAGSDFVPTSSLFRYELKVALEEKYRSLQTAVKLWSIAASDIETWDQLARLIPLWSGNRGVAELYDPTSEKVYLCDAKRSTAWTDIHDAILTAERERQSKLVQALRQASQVPVLQEWRGWSDLYEGTTCSVDGVGMRASGSGFSAIAESGAPAISSAIRSPKPSWVPATDIDIAKEAIPSSLQDLEDMGARGWFFRSSSAEEDRAIASLGSPSASLAEDSPQAIFYPESATNPAAPQRLPGGKWWLPSPAAGNRIALGAGFSCYRYEDGVLPFYEIWQDGPPARTRLRLAEPRKAIVKSLSGQDLQLKYLKFGIELTMGSEPITISGIDEIPVPELAFNEVSGEISAILHATERSMLGPGTENSEYEENVRSFERSPGGAFTRMVNQLRNLRLRFGPYVWQEGEATRRSTFSETTQVSGCSGGAVLALHAAMPGGAYYAEYDIPLRTRLDQEVWIAAKIPKGQEKLWTIEIGGQIMHLETNGVSGYGTGFAWYRAGRTRLINNPSKMRISVEPAQGTEAALDAIVLFPGTFHPNGQTMPPVALPGPVER